MDYLGHHFEHDEKATEEAQKDADAFHGCAHEVKRGCSDFSAPNRSAARRQQGRKRRARGLQRNMTDDRLVTAEALGECRQRPPADYIGPMICIAISLAAYQAIASIIPGGASN
jgi:hypothetical protein